MDGHFHWVLLDVGPPHLHAGEGPLVGQRPLGDEQAGVGRDAHPVLVVVRGLDGGPVLVGLLHQQISRCAVVPVLLEREHRVHSARVRDAGGPRYSIAGWGRLQYNYT